MRCLIIHNLASGPKSDEIFTFAQFLSQTGTRWSCAFWATAWSPKTRPQT